MGQHNGHGGRQNGHGGFRHEALFYAGEREFLDGTVPFIRAAVAAREPILIMVAEDKIGLLRAELNAEAARVLFADMAVVGRNPARIIPAWRRFVDAAADGREVRGIGEPIWPGRTAAELAECERHESLINLAFAGVSGFRLLCPYDADRLDPADLEAARRTHPWVDDGGIAGRSDAFRPEIARRPFDGSLPEPPGEAAELEFTGSNLAGVRRFVSRQAGLAGLDTSRLSDLVSAANELAANSVRHAGGGGRLRIWNENGALLCEVRDSGRFYEPLVGRLPPTPRQDSGRGLWIANHLCDLVQIRSGTDGSVARLHMSLG